MTDAHLEKSTLHVEVYVPAHPDRKASALFERTRQQLIARDKVCWICGRTAEESGHPLEAHHAIVEWSLINMIDIGLVKADYPAFDSPEKVDDMIQPGQGLLLCKLHHTGEEGIHSIDYPRWLAQRYGKEGYKFSDAEIIHHEV